MMLSTSGTDSEKGVVPSWDGNLEHGTFLEQLEIQRQDILVTEETLDKGCWKQVNVAEYRGIPVAAKYPHNEASHPLELFVQEVKLAARVRHPNLALFMGACINEETIVVMEMPSSDSLRQYLYCREEQLPLDASLSIALDVVRALNYLHLMQPCSIIHRNLNSSTVLLEPLPRNKWRAKVTDYCFADFKLPITPKMEYYVEPEGRSVGVISPKVDIFSFGILLVELNTGFLPDASNYDSLSRSIKDYFWFLLIQHCTQSDRDHRPSAADIIMLLNERHQLRTQRVQLKKAEIPWQCPQKRSVQLPADDVTLHVFQGILNKITTQNFRKLAQQILWLEINNKKRLDGITEKITESAFSQQQYRSIYAKLSHAMRGITVDWEEDDGDVRMTNFHQVLLTRVQNEFEKHGNDEHVEALRNAMGQANSVESRNVLSQKMAELKEMGRKRYIGVVCFIGELFKVNFVSESIIHECMRRLLRSAVDEDSLECFAALFTVVGQHLETKGANSRMNTYVKKLNDLTRMRISPCVLFKLMDALELWQNEWIPLEHDLDVVEQVLSSHNMRDTTPQELDLDEH